MSTVLEVAHPQCAAEVLEDEVVVLNVETGVYFSLRGRAAALWQDLAAGHPVESLAIDGSDGERITAFVEQLSRYGLMRPATVGPAGGELPLRAMTGDGRSEIVFEVYEDMQDLILSDPIHDVDESAGWPVPRSQSA